MCRVVQPDRRRRRMIQNPFGLKLYYCRSILSRGLSEGFVLYSIIECHHMVSVPESVLQALYWSMSGRSEIYRVSWQISIENVMTTSIKNVGIRVCTSDVFVIQHGHIWRFAKWLISLYLNKFNVFTLLVRVLSIYLQTFCWLWKIWW